MCGPSLAGGLDSCHLFQNPAMVVLTCYSVYVKYMEIMVCGFMFTS